MKKLKLIGFLAAAVVIAASLAFVGCGGDSSSSGGAVYDPLVIYGQDGEKEVVVEISTTRTIGRAVLTPRSGDAYKIWVDKVLVSEGVIQKNSSDPNDINLMFVPSNGGEPFFGSFNGSTLRIAGDAPLANGGSLGRFQQIGSSIGDGRKITSLEIGVYPALGSLYQYEFFSAAGLVLNVVYEDGTPAAVEYPWNGFIFEPSLNEPLSEKGGNVIKVKHTASGISTDIKFNVQGPRVSVSNAVPTEINGTAQKVRFNYSATTEMHWGFEHYSLDAGDWMIADIDRGSGWIDVYLNSGNVGANTSTQGTISVYVWIGTSVAKLTTNTFTLRRAAVQTQTGAKGISASFTKGSTSGTGTLRVETVGAGGTGVIAGKESTDFTFAASGADTTGLDLANDISLVETGTNSGVYEADITGITGVGAIVVTLTDGSDNFDSAPVMILYGDTPSITSSSFAKGPKDGANSTGTITVTAIKGDGSPLTGLAAYFNFADGTTSGGVTFAGGVAVGDLRAVETSTPGKYTVAVPAFSAGGGVKIKILTTSGETNQVEVAVALAGTPSVTATFAKHTTTPGAGTISIVTDDGVGGKYDGKAAWFTFANAGASDPTWISGGNDTPTLTATETSTPGNYTVTVTGLKSPGDIVIKLVVDGTLTITANASGGSKLTLNDGWPVKGLTVTPAQGAGGAGTATLTVVAHSGVGPITGRKAYFTTAAATSATDQLASMTPAIGAVPTGNVNESTTTAGEYTINISAYTAGGSGGKKFKLSLNGGVYGTIEAAAEVTLP